MTAIENPDVTRKRTDGAINKLFLVALAIIEVNIVAKKQTTENKYLSGIESRLISLIACLKVPQNASNDPRYIRRNISPPKFTSFLPK